jgi:hypothetical protein
VNVIIRTALTPPIRVALTGGASAAGPADDSGGSFTDPLLRFMRPTVELEGSGFQIAPWGVPGDWRIPAAIVAGLVALGLVFLVKKAS